MHDVIPVDENLGGAIMVTGFAIAGCGFGWALRNGAAGGRPPRVADRRSGTRYMALGIATGGMGGAWMGDAVGVLAPTDAVWGMTMLVGASGLIVLVGSVLLGWAEPVGTVRTGPSGHPHRAAAPWVAIGSIFVVLVSFGLGLVFGRWRIGRRGVDLDATSDLTLLLGIAYVFLAIAFAFRAVHRVRHLPPFLPPRTPPTPPVRTWPPPQGWPPPAPPPSLSGPPPQRWPPPDPPPDAR